MRARLGLPYWSLVAVPEAPREERGQLHHAFEDALAREARTRGFDGVVCGHIHHAEIRAIDGVLYCNAGDWVESLTALVEAQDGTLSICGGARCDRAHRDQRPQSSRMRACRTPERVDNRPSQPPGYAPQRTPLRILIVS